MAVDSSNRSREEERVIDSYWASGESLDPILKTEQISNTNTYLQLGLHYLKMMDYQVRGIESGDLDNIDEEAATLTARATKYQKITITVKRRPSPPLSFPEMVYLKRSQDV